jgi:hypothetical protein
MNKFEILIHNTEKFDGGEVYYRKVRPMPDNDDGKHFIDPRTMRNEEWKYIVKPFCFYNSHYWYVCPICGELHPSEFGGKITAGCCDGDNQKQSPLKSVVEMIQFESIVLETE